MRRHLLLIDDDEEEFLFISKIIEEIPGAKSSYTSNITNGIELLKTGIPDIVLLDMNMPCQDGLECLKLLRQEESFASIPIIIYSAGADEYLAAEASKHGADGCIKKPPGIDLLRQMLLKILGAGSL